MGKIKSRNIFSGYANLGQISLALLALQLYNDKSGQQGKSLDVEAIHHQISRETFPGIETDLESHFVNHFDHLTDYAAAYYGYLWSKVFACDVFQQIDENDGLLDADWGRKYASTILCPGGSKDPNEFLEEFLGREPSIEPFLNTIGIGTKMEDGEEEEEE
eukprot:NODE_5319_length_586_cov_50.361266_g4608_i0.p1 GENE.NODE_5319_length_586_cov_50.361266_g4608_i0~~NODE_5319_length_586_cov_50.361266_g4608_i0.p1  ORF type:complete len:169 (+),score=49.04 NODE_5319_length_586_cov_50.361266_g4608_i0:27-509(+)